MRRYQVTMKDREAFTVNDKGYEVNTYNKIKYVFMTLDPDTDSYRQIDIAKIKSRLKTNSMVYKKNEAKGTMYWYGEAKLIEKE